MKTGYSLLLLVLAALFGATITHAQGGSHRAGLVVRYTDGSVETACVSFPEEQISGAELLTRSELSVTVQDGGIGTAVCKIGRDGCDYPAEQCFCERDGATAIYWAYYQQDGAAWRYASLGAGNTPVHDGDVNGWAWGAGDSSGGALPPLVGFDAICGPPERPTLSAAVAPAPRSTTSPLASPLPTEPSQAEPIPATADFYPAAPPQAVEQPTGGTSQLLIFGLFVILLVGAIGFVLWSKR